MEEYFLQYFLPQLQDKSNYREKKNKNQTNNLSKIKSEATPIEQPGSRSQAAVRGDEEKPSALCVQKYHKKLKSWERSFWIPELLF